MQVCGVNTNQKTIKIFLSTCNVFNISIIIVKDKDENHISELKNFMSMNKRNNITKWLVAGASIAACASLIWIIFPFVQQFFQSYNTIAKVENTSTPLEEATIISDEPSLIEQETESLIIAEAKKSISSKAVTVKAIREERETKEFIESQTAETEIKQENTQTENKKETPSLKESFNSHLSADYNLLSSLEKKTQKKTSFGVYTGSSTGELIASNEKSSDFVYYDASQLRNDIMENDGGQYNIPLTSDNFSNISHNIPLSFGLSFRKDLNQYISLETGLVYTYLYSKFRNKYPREELKQGLHYLGIPIKGVVNIYSDKSDWHIYFSAGIMMEKGLNAHYSYIYHDNNRNYSTSSNENIKGLQWSVNAALGFGYKLNNSYSIYFEPNINYYLDNNQPLNSRTQNPITIGVSAGLRYIW
ncbi:hypothetical protein M2138_000858 [Dysgonomonadaceae bacterium PH5-43]|nr:hypothetical protein [Dysgonomonadaceae bacterium PH5-43]